MWYLRMFLLWVASLSVVYGSNSGQLTSGENVAALGLSPSQVESLCATPVGVSNLVRTLDYVIEVAAKPTAPLATNSGDTANAGSCKISAPEKERERDGSRVARDYHAQKTRSPSKR
jgi:hypothetical protein